MSKRFTLKLELNEFEELSIHLPDEVSEDLGWYEGNELEFEVDDVSGSFTLKKVEE
tara:strand:+ start:477 stop:644 length:168 start_codon:yes stop_codon:yes gene_type:complete